MFERKKYLNRLIAGVGNGMVKIVTGIRRCGKSYLLFVIFTKWLKDNGVDEPHIIGLQLDDFRNRNLRNPEQLLDYIDSNLPKDGKKVYVLLDEIQLVENFVEVMLSLMHTPDLEIYVSGSNSRFLSSEVVTEFRGRGWEIRVHPLSLAEFIEGTGMEYNIAVSQYFVYGGLPQVALMNSFEDKELFLKELYELTYLRDIIERNNLRNVDSLREFIRVIASTATSSSNPKRIADTFKSTLGLEVSVNSIRHYIQYMSESYLIEESLRYDVKGRKYIGTESKFYFEDLGLRNVILNFRQIEETHLMENLIYNHLRAQSYLVDVGMIEVWDKNESGKKMRKHLEVDFVVNRGSQRIYIQSAYAMPSAEKRQQEAASLRQINDSFQKIIVVSEDIPLRRDEVGIITMSLKQFLLSDNFLEAACK